jgi:glycerate 2-kinase
MAAKDSLTLFFDELLDTASLVITGEGYLDGQTLHGKAPLGVARRGADDAWVKEIASCMALFLQRPEL